MERAVRSIRDFIQANLDSRFSSLNQGDSTVRTHDRAGFKDSENVYLLEPGLKEACGGRDCLEVKKHLKSIGWLNTPEKDRYTTKISTPGQGRVSGVYSISLEKINEAPE